MFGHLEWFSTNSQQTLFLIVIVKIQRKLSGKCVCDNKKTPPLPENVTHIHPLLLDLMKQCWNWDHPHPQQCPSFTQIVQILRQQMKTENEVNFSFIYIHIQKRKILDFEM
jgi:hypothetical protein